MEFNELMRFVFSGFWIWLGFAILLSIICNSIVKMWVAMCSIFTTVYEDDEDEDILDGVTIVEETKDDKSDSK